LRGFHRAAERLNVGHRRIDSVESAELGSLRANIALSVPLSRTPDLVHIPK
jgi:hypothetical protein